MASTNLSIICDTISQLKLEPEKARRIIMLLRAMQANDQYTMLMHVAVFHELWSALEEAAYTSANIEMEEPR